MKLYRYFSFFLLAMASGCSSLPDVGPFVAASQQLRSAVAISGSTVESELRTLPGGDSSADELKKAWVERNRTFRAMENYSASLKSVVDAGNDGAASAKKVADSITGLAQALNVYPGAGESVGAAAQIAGEVYRHIALARAAKSLEAAMEKAQPAVDLLAGMVQADLKDLEDIFVAANRDADTQVRKDYQAVTGYRLQLLRNMSNADLNDPKTIAQQVRWAQLLQGTEGPYAEYLAKRKVIDDRLRAGRLLIHATVQSSSDWATAHQQVLTAVRERRPVDMESLLQAASEIQRLVNKVRAL